MISRGGHNGLYTSSSMIVLTVGAVECLVETLMGHPVRCSTQINKHRWSCLNYCKKPVKSIEKIEKNPYSSFSIIDAYFSSPSILGQESLERTFPRASDITLGHQNWFYMSFRVVQVSKWPTLSWNKCDMSARFDMLEKIFVLPFVRWERCPFKINKFLASLFAFKFYFSETKFIPICVKRTFLWLRSHRVRWLPSLLNP